MLAAFVFAAFTISASAADNDLQPAAEIKLNASVSQFLPSPDKKSVYFLNKSDGKIQRIDIAKKALDDTAIELDGAEAITMSPDGKTIYASASPNGHNSNSGAEKEVGKIQVVNLADQKVTSTIEIKFDPFEIAADNSGKVYATGGSNQHTKVAVIDTKKKSIIADLGRVYMGANLRMAPDGKRMYFSTNGLSPGSAEGIWQAGGKRSTGPGGGPFVITSDGKFMVFQQSGLVLRLGKSVADDMKEAAKVKPHRAAAIDVEGKSVWLATAEGELIKLSYPDFELETTLVLPKPAYQLYIDSSSKTLIAALDNKKDRRKFDKEPGVGNIAIFNLGEMKKRD
ncbi:MAG: hypothetical protein C0467_24935 [Planctomycetaceae bacterium]|nr:hypothetical protein [Planctomycetaceae bacterium]